MVADPGLTTRYKTKRRTGAAKTPASDDGRVEKDSGNVDRLNACDTGEGIGRWRHDGDGGGVDSTETELEQASFSDRIRGGKQKDTEQKIKQNYLNNAPASLLPAKEKEFQQAEGVWNNTKRYRKPSMNDSKNSNTTISLRSKRQSGSKSTKRPQIQEKTPNDFNSNATAVEFHPKKNELKKNEYNKLKEIQAWEPILYDNGASNELEKFGLDEKRKKFFREPLKALMQKIQLGYKGGRNGDQGKLDELKGDRHRGFKMANSYGKEGLGADILRRDPEYLKELSNKLKRFVLSQDESDKSDYEKFKLLSSKDIEEIYNRAKYIQALLEPIDGDLGRINVELNDLHKSLEKISTVLKSIKESHKMKETTLAIRNSNHLTNPTNPGSTSFDYLMHHFLKFQNPTSHTSPSYGLENIDIGYVAYSGNKNALHSSFWMVTEEDFNNAIRNSASGSQIRHVVLYPDSCRMFIVIQTVEGSFLHRKDLRDRDYLAQYSRF